ncbi:MAG: hypothetical protein HWE27_14105 [Gammaproteobacteria bacterium]|nr:hypothetical protein [Gammaproteobacteria bacterium]
MISKIYLFVLLLYLILKSFTVFYFGGWFSFTNKDANQFSLIFDIVFIVGVFGFAFNKAILIRGVWLTLSAVSALWYLAVPSYEIYILYSAGNLYVVNFLHLLYTYGPFIPLVGIPVCLYKYSINSENIWAK